MAAETERSVFHLSLLTVEFIYPAAAALATAIRAVLAAAAAAATILCKCQIPASLAFPCELKTRDSAGILQLN